MCATPWGVAHTTHHSTGAGPAHEGALYLADHACRPLKVVGGQGDHEPARLEKFVSPDGVTSALTFLKVDGSVVLHDDSLLPPAQVHPRDPATVGMDVDVALRLRKPGKHEKGSHDRFRWRLGARIQQRDRASGVDDAAATEGPPGHLVKVSKRSKPASQSGISQGNEVGHRDVRGAVQPGSRRCRHDQPPVRREMFGR